MPEVTERTVSTQSAIITAIVTSTNTSISDKPLRNQVTIYETLSGHITGRSEKRRKSSVREVSAANTTSLNILI